MKTLKLDHASAEFIVNGRLASTWRLYDDKDLLIDDEVELIDKVDSENRATWRPIGTARINEVIQKRIGDIAEFGDQGEGRVLSQAEMLKVCQKYYGPQVSLKTPIKIIHFNFTPSKNKLAHIEDKKTTKTTEIKLFADGGSRGNPGPSASGFVVMDMDQNVIVKRGIYLGITTNNQAEYQALKVGLEEAARMRIQVVHVYMDSLLVINQMLGVFKVKNRDLWPIHDAVKKLAATFKRVTYTQVPREFNKLADVAVNEILDVAAGSQKPIR